MPSVLSAYEVAGIVVDIPEISFQQSLIEHLNDKVVSLSERQAQETGDQAAADLREAALLWISTEVNADGTQTRVALVALAALEGTS
jgi:CRISPR/Cas system-associated protein Csm6